MTFITSADAVHGYTMTGDVSARWIEVYTPAPANVGASVFPTEWHRHAGP